MNSKETNFKLNLVVDDNDFNSELICTFNFNINEITYCLNLTPKTYRKRFR